MRAREYLTIQVLRGLAAGAVVLSHLTLFEAKYLPGPGLAPAALDFGMAGVDLFFVISGFVITRTTMGQFGQPGAVTRFARKRFTRIYPVYWAYYFAVLAVLLVRPEMVNASAGAPDLLRSFLLLPTSFRGELVPVAWTLEYEVFFYFVFACALRWLPERRLPMALAGWATLIVAGNLLLQPTDHTPALNMLFGPLILEFMAGCMVARLVPRLSAAQGAAALGTGLLLATAAVAGFAAFGREFPLYWGRVVLFGGSATLIVAGCAALEGHLRSRIPRLLVRLGDASYSLYLSHMLTIAVVGHLWARFLAGPSAADHLAALASAFGLAILMGFASHYALERPLLGLTRRTLDLMPRLRVRRVVPAAARGSLPAATE